jgi:hypothetical protein
LVSPERLFARAAAVACVACAAASAGCFVSSLHPVYDDASIVFDESLLGTWENREGELSVVVSAGEWRSYHVAFTDRFGTTELIGRLTRVGRVRLVNLLPAAALDRPMFVLVTNGFVQIDLQPEGLRVRVPEYAVVAKRAAAGRLGVASATDMKQNVVLTASTRSLRAWLAASQKDETLWSEWTTFTRSSQ